MRFFDHDTQLTPSAPGRYQGQVQPHWNIGSNPNGGYLLALAGQALRLALPEQPDPLSVTAHYLQPGLGGQACQVDVQLLRQGRSLSTASATLLQDGTPRLSLLAAMGALQAAAEPLLTLPRPELPPPEQCAPRSGHAQGISLPILDRLDIRLDPAWADPGGRGRAQVGGWIRFRDGREPDPLACLLFVDAFPPALFIRLGPVGWVPTVELTVQLRARPAPGWMQAQFWTEDLSDGRLVEDGALWDSQGRLVAQSRQLALVRLPASAAGAA